MDGLVNMVALVAIALESIIVSLIDCVSDLRLRSLGSVKWHALIAEWRVANSFSYV